MSLELMYITNKPEVAKIAEEAGINRVWIDLETLGKQERQAGYDSVKSKHTLDDIAAIKPLLSRAKLQVRVNPINPDSKAEIDTAICNGADIVMLPMFKTVGEVKFFIQTVNGRAKTMLLLETKEAEEILDDILELDGIDEIHIGLNDLHLSYKKIFMFEMLADGTVESICQKIKSKNIRYGFGGIAKLGEGMLPAENIIAEHYRLGSSMAILARSFCNTDKIEDLDEIRRIFNSGIAQIRSFEGGLNSQSEMYFHNNNLTVKEIVLNIVNKMNQRKQLSEVSS